VSVKRHDGVIWVRISPRRRCFRVGRSKPLRPGVSARNLQMALARSSTHGHVLASRKVRPLD